MGRLERFERKERIKRMNQAKAKERAHQIAVCKAEWKRYFNWASSRPTKIKKALAFSPGPLLILSLIVIGSVGSVEEYEPETDPAAENITALTAPPEAEPEYVEPEAEYIEPEPEYIEPEPEYIEPEPAPKSPAEQCRSAVVSNTPGLSAQQHVGFMDADALQSQLMPVVRSFTTDPAVSLDETETIVSDMLRKVGFASNQKMADNMAKGLVETAISPGSCN